MTAEAINRVGILQAAMRERGVEVCIVGPSDSLRYLIGHAEHPDERLVALVVSRDDAVMILPDFGVAEFTAVAGRPAVAPWADRYGPASAVEEAFGRLALADGPALVDGELPFRYLTHLRDRIAAPASADPLLAELRLRKSDAELELMARAGELVSAGIDFAQATAEPGMTERDLKRRIEELLWQEGADSVDCVLVQAGANAANVHHAADDTVLRAGEAVLIDIAVRRDGYFSDITQQVFLGEVTDEYREHYDVVRRAQIAGVQAVRVGATAHDVASAASQVVIDAGLVEFNSPRTGHGIGLGLHEEPSVVEDNHAELVAGAVITVEPGVYIPGKHGIRIEDTVVVTEDGPRCLTRGARDLVVR